MTASVAFLRGLHNHIRRKGNITPPIHTNRHRTIFHKRCLHRFDIVHFRVSRKTILKRLVRKLVIILFEIVDCLGRFDVLRHIPLFASAALFNNIDCVSRYHSFTSPHRIETVAVNKCRTHFFGTVALSPRVPLNDCCKRVSNTRAYAPLILHFRHIGAFVLFGEVDASHNELHFVVPNIGFAENCTKLHIVFSFHQITFISLP